MPLSVLFLLRVKVVTEHRGWGGCRHATLQQDHRDVCIKQHPFSPAIPSCNVSLSNRFQIHILIYTSNAVEGYRSFTLHYSPLCCMSFWLHRCKYMYRHWVNIDDSAKCPRSALRWDSLHRLRLRRRRRSCQICASAIANPVLLHNRTHCSTAESRLSTRLRYTHTYTHGG